MSELLNLLTTDTLDVWRCYVDVGLFMLIWLVQLIIYPSFAHARESTFVQWHHQYTGLISLFVAPLMFSQTGLYAVLCVKEMRWHDLVGLASIAGVWLSTIALSVPCHSRLHAEGYNLATIERLVRTNWIRTLLWTSMFVIDLLTISPTR